MDLIRFGGRVNYVGLVSSSFVEVCLYDRLFKSEMPDAAGDFLSDLNPQSLEVLEVAKMETSVAGAASSTRYQFEPLGYFCVDPDTTPLRLVFNRTVTLKDA